MRLKYANVMVADFVIIVYPVCPCCLANLQSIDGGLTNLPLQTAQLWYNKHLFAG